MSCYEYLLTLTRLFFSCIDRTQKRWSDDTTCETVPFTPQSVPSVQIFHASRVAALTETKKYQFKMKLHACKPRFCWVVGNIWAVQTWHQLGDVTPRHRLGRRLHPHRVWLTRNIPNTLSQLLAVSSDVYISDHTAPPHFLGTSVRSKNSQVVLTDKRWCEAAWRERDVL